jgi:hypothetical protein
MLSSSPRKRVNSDFFMAYNISRKNRKGIGHFPQKSISGFSIHEINAVF